MLIAVSSFGESLRRVTSHQPGGGDLISNNRFKNLVLEFLIRAGWSVSRGIAVSVVEMGTLQANIRDRLIFYKF